jgi:hypothetical protein
MEAVSRYVDIPAATRLRLVARIDAGRADDDVVITRDAIEGRGSYASASTDMHFGRQTVCGRVTRERWPVTAREPAKVYCADGHCLIVPRICGNISRIRVASGGNASDSAGEGAGGGYAPRSASMPQPAGAPEVDIEAADAMAQLAVAASAPAPTMPLSVADRPFGDWTPGPAWGAGNAPGAGPARTAPLSPVPEPAGWLMFVIGAAGMLAYARFRR